jgi:HSP20 family protein
MASITPYRPRDLFFDLRRDVDDVFSSWLSGPRSRTLSSDTFFAPLDVHETDKDFTIRMDVPGVTEKDVKVTCHGDTLTISGERRAEKTETRSTARYTERTYGSFTRSMTLPVHVQHDAIRARYSNGVLEVVVPKAPSAQQREIKIES